MIRLALSADLSTIDQIYAHARAFMAANGNPTQWGQKNPPSSLLRQDVAAGRLYVCEDENGHIYGVFAFLLGEDPTYGYIEGEWHHAAPYGTIHRIASNGSRSGVFVECAEFCRNIIPHLRVDTHQNNLPMQRAAERYGFRRCGIIYVADGTPRIAYDFLAE